MTTPDHPMPPHLPGDTAVILSISNAIFEVLPPSITVVAGLMAIAWYGVLFYDRFRKKPIDPK